MLTLTLNPNPNSNPDLQIETSADLIIGLLIFCIEHKSEFNSCD